jgi:hypothetical protein
MYTTWEVFMPKGENPDPSVSLAKGSHGRYVVQDMKNCDKKQASIQLVIKPDSGASQEDSESWYTPDFIKINFKK